MIYLNGSFDLTKITEENMDDVEEEPEGEKSKKEKPKKEEPRTKMDAILDIIRGKKPEESKRVDVNISNLMKGTHAMPACSYNKVLIFANYDETLKHIREMLEKNKIEYWKLEGTHKEIASTAEKFTNCKKTCVMIVNSIKHCSGLNLQTATDLIFAHKIIDRNIETQVTGRGQRLGRTSQLKVHFMFYKNEYEWMERDGTIREIEDTEEPTIAPIEINC